MSYAIAEISQNHNGSIDRMRRLIDAAKWAVVLGDRQRGRAPIGTPWHHPKGRACETIADILRNIVKP